MGQVISLVILSMVSIVVAVVLFPVINDQVTEAINNGTPNDTTDDITGADASLLQLVPTLFVVAIIGLPVGLLVSTFRGRR